MTLSNTALRRLAPWQQADWSVVGGSGGTGGFGGHFASLGAIGFGSSRYVAVGMPAAPRPHARVRLRLFGLGDDGDAIDYRLWFGWFGLSASKAVAWDRSPVVLELVGQGVATLGSTVGPAGGLAGASVMSDADRIVDTVTFAETASGADLREVVKGQAPREYSPGSGSQARLSVSDVAGAHVVVLEPMHPTAGLGAVVEVFT
ncbi:MAG: hypothetical protein AAGI53_09510 [Planctomycetota bacterium]